MYRFAALLDPWSGTILAGPAESRPRGRPRSAYALWGVGGVGACALAGMGVLMGPASPRGEGDGRRAMTACYNLPAWTRAAQRGLGFKWRLVASWSAFLKTNLGVGHRGIVRCLTP